MSINSDAYKKLCLFDKNLQLGVFWKVLNVYNFRVETTLKTELRVDCVMFHCWKFRQNYNTVHFFLESRNSVNSIFFLKMHSMMTKRKVLKKNLTIIPFFA